ncbi:nuclease PIN [Acaricomes phytoseiuli]|uniref:DUF47 domain-containing protein n=1 Tax=Acaricomes phytoseiuli TaxID=291968 RepID=UPI00037BDD4F|nr:hypothetical protein [Acaricomes phytoseiuli]MCW1249207.1 nuclease PIN [Acaricomes phytoseiuli]
MKFRLFPKERNGLKILSEMAGQLVSGVQLLSEMFGTSRSGYVPLAEQIHGHETHSTNLLYSLLTHIRSSFISPLPREDIYALSRVLHEAMGKLDAAAELLVIYRIDRIPRRATEQLEVIGRQAELTVTAMRALDDLDGLEDYWLEMIRLSQRAEHTHRKYLAELLDPKPNSYLKHRELALQLVETTRDFRRLATQVGGIIVKES